MSSVSPSSDFLSHIKRDTLHNHLPEQQRPKRVLLITHGYADEDFAKSYYAALVLGGNLAVDIVQPSDVFLDMFPKANNSSGYDFSALLKAYDGFAFSGGRPNIHPHRYGGIPTDDVYDPVRDTLSIGLFQQADASKPMLGICLGMQHLAVAHGAKMKYTDDHFPDDDQPAYAPSHPVRFQYGSIFHTLAKAGSEVVERGVFAKAAAHLVRRFRGLTRFNSVHHWMVDRAALVQPQEATHSTTQLMIGATTYHGDIEALHVKGTNHFGVQGHPEKILLDDFYSRRLLALFGMIVRGEVDLRDEHAFKGFWARAAMRTRIALQAKRLSRVYLKPSNA